MKHDYTDEELLEAFEKSKPLKLGVYKGLSAFLDALPERPQAAEITEMKAALFQAQEAAKDLLAQRDKAQAELAAAHSVLDGDPSEIIRNAAQGYPEGRAPREMTLAERVQTLCRYAADYAEWHQKTQAELAALRQPADDSRSLGQVAFDAGNIVQKIKFPKQEIETWEENAEFHDMLEAAAQAVVAAARPAIEAECLAQAVRRMEAVTAVEVADIIRKTWLDRGGWIEPAAEAIRARLIAAAKGEGQVQPVVVNEPPQDERQPDLSGESEKQTEPAWIPHDGGPCPLKDEEVEEFEFKIRENNESNPVSFFPSAWRWRNDGTAGDIIAYRVLRWKPGFGPEAKAEPATFEAHGKTWTRHTPGDPMPCQKGERIHWMYRDKVTGVTKHPEVIGWRRNENKYTDIIGWRYADEPAQPQQEPLPIATLARDQIDMTPAMAEAVEAVLREELRESAQPTTSPGWTPSVGDTVRLKSGGPVMTVKAVDKYVRCVHYTEKHGWLECVASAACLTPAKP